MLTLVYDLKVSHVQVNVGLERQLLLRACDGQAGGGGPACA
jgi:hypothetical protein